MEQEQSQQRDDARQDLDQQPYYQAACFPNERRAGRAYFRAQRTIYDSPRCDLSVFRFQLARVYHVAVLGAPPLPDLEGRLRSILSAGVPATLPAEVIAMLQGRRAEAAQLGPWVEGHYRPGEHL